MHHHFDAKTFEVFDPTIDLIHRNLRPKISLVGFSGVGKTTITRLIKADEIPMQHIPTITGDIATIKIGKLHFHLWDFAGQEQFSYLWNNFIKGSDAVLLITDSTLENVEKSKYFLELIKQQAPNAQSAVIGNKQDLREAMNPVQIEKVLGLKAYSMIALDPTNRDKMIQIIADVLEMSAEVSPLLKPLLERDKFTEDAVRALKNADFDKAAFLFDKISDLCIELGDDSLGKEFFEKSQKIKDMLKKVGAPPPVSANPIEPEERKAPLENTKFKQPIIIQNPPLGTKELPQSPQKHLTVQSEESKTEDIDLAPENTQEDIGIKLNPEDFMIRARPKSVSYVPEDAKSKLKLSSSALDKNKTVSTAPVAVSPLKLMEEKAKSHLSTLKAVDSTKTIQESREAIPSQKSEDISPKSVINDIQAKPVITKSEAKIILDQSQKKPPHTEIQKNYSIMSPEQKVNLKKSLLDLKIRKSHLTKMILDFEMQELKGEITSEDLNDKKGKVQIMMDKIDKEIQDIENLYEE
ncbi:MAG: ADP-ribosylation factor-like protein [Promethearchaeota archaeon]